VCLERQSRCHPGPIPVQWLKREPFHCRPDGDVVAPDLVDVETVAVLRKRWLAGTVTDHRFAAEVDDLQSLPIDRYPTLSLMRRAYELRANITAYDAAYIALAEALHGDLLTGDVQLSKAPGPRCTIRLIH
jgi:predicted nucleic acid-binding protein